VSTLKTASTEGDEKLPRNVRPSRLAAESKRSKRLLPLAREQCEEDQNNAEEIRERGDPSGDVGDDHATHCLRSSTASVSLIILSTSRVLPVCLTTCRPAPFRTNSEAANLACAGSSKTIR
jgi:hypothetical protein